MEEKTPPPPAARSAQALRELHDRARSALDAQRQRMGTLEAQLTEQLDSIAETLAEQLSSGGTQNDRVGQSHSEVEQLRLELENARTAWNEEREQLASETATQNRLLEEGRVELETCAAQLAAGRGELDVRQQALDDRAIDLNHRDRELRQRQELLDGYAAQCAAQQSQLSANESALDTRREVIAAREAELQALETQLEIDRVEIKTREQSYQIALSAERDAIRAEHEALQVTRLAFQGEKISLDGQREGIAEQLAALASTNQVQNDDVESTLLGLRQTLEAESAAWERERITFIDQRRLLAKERDELAQALDAARGELAVARAEAGAVAERDELQQKFDLALEDMQRLRGCVAELQQELASRPAPDQTDSVELVHLRSERDSLVERISELEQESGTLVDSDAAQERADSQRRFELAVDDVRELKKRNAQLEAQLADLQRQGGSAVPLASAGSSSGWEAMKKQMLASLEGESEAISLERDQERVTIESTIRITDEALVHKDREIAELKVQLAEGASKSFDDRENEEFKRLIDADAVIAEHRLRIAKLEQEMNEKLRTAELELSIERAKIAREQSHLAGLRSELDSQQTMNDSVRGADGQAPKRRWLSKLGLLSDDDAP